MMINLFYRLFHHFTAYSSTMIPESKKRRLADRLGTTCHVSPLRMKIRRLMGCYPAHQATVPEDWLVDVAISRGVKHFVRDAAEGAVFLAPPQEEFSDEELVVGLCQTVALDRPQMVRMAGQIITRNKLDLEKFQRLIEMERVEVVVAELARAALRCDSDHPLWRTLWESYQRYAGVRSPVIHWSRLAEPMLGKNHQIQGWKLAS
ncbi:MAG TPA: hypothetical protein PJ991_07670 [Kiritimatiellia bacterium]|nr:hypothetical protein [Kiritimatiellia bacterium]